MASRTKLGSLAGCLVALLALPATGQGSRPLVSPTAKSVMSHPGINRFLTQAVLRAIPREYEKTKDWGQTKEVTRGLKVTREGLRIKTKRRRSRVNHGTWKRYRLALTKPDEFQIRFSNLRDAGEHGVQFDTVVEARLNVFGRLSQWERGVQLISLSTEGEAKVRLHATCQLNVTLDQKLPPEIVLQPKVINARAELLDFRVQRISNLGGALSHELGKGMRRFVEDSVAEQQPKLAGKINRQIEKKKDRLRLSLSDLY